MVRAALPPRVCYDGLMTGGRKVVMQLPADENNVENNVRNMMAQDQTEDQTNQLLVYGRPGCPMVPPVRTYLDEAGVAYTFIDIRQSAEASAQLRALAGGFESVPTVVLPGGQVLVEPSVARLRKALKEIGQPDEAGLGGTLKAGLSNPVYPVLLLIALALAVAIALASLG